MKMALGDRIGGRLIARFKLKAAQLRLDCHHDRAPNWRIMTTHPICFDSAAESPKSQESINRSRYEQRQAPLRYRAPSSAPTVLIMDGPGRLVRARLGVAAAGSECPGSKGQKVRWCR